MSTEGLNTGETNPYTTPYILENGNNGSFSEQLWFTAGQSSPFGQMVIILVVSAWVVWPVNFSTIYCAFKIGPIRSDLFFSVFWGLILPVIIPAAGMFAGRDAFVWIKQFSLVTLSMIFVLFKYIMPFPHQSRKVSVACTLAVHGCLLVNIAEACYWEVAKLNQGPYNYINGIGGAILIFCLCTYSYQWGCGVMCTPDDKIRQMRCNLTPIFVIAYTIWNIEYNACYHPEKAMYYIFASLLAPLVGAFTGHIDWLEVRVHALLHAANLRLLPGGGNGPLISLIGIGESFYQNEALRYILSIISFLSCVLCAYESVRCVLKGESHIKITEYIGIKDTFDIDDHHHRGLGGHAEPGDDTNDKIIPAEA